MSSTWLHEHLETVVRPYLGKIPASNPHDQWVLTFDKKMLVALQAVWDQTKRLAKGKTILLPGRDVWLFEVVARVLGDYPTVFRPDISTSTAPHVSEDYSKYFVLDTGYKGSVPRALKCDHWVLVRYDCTSADPKLRTLENRPTRQVFPKVKRGPLMNLSSNLEGCPKYWTRAALKPKSTQFSQQFDSTYFELAAVLTMHVAQNVMPMRSRVRKMLMIPYGRLL